MNLIWIVSLKEVASQVILIKNGVGQAVFPSYAINDIGDWNVLEGYKVKAFSPFTLTLGCTKVEPDTPIVLSAGWTIIPYLKDQPLDAAIALASLNPNIILVKDGSGLAYFPLYGINDIGDMLPGQGYQLKLFNEDTLVYPATGKTSSSVAYRKPADPQYYDKVFNTGNNATIIIPVGSVEGLKHGDEVGIFSKEGILAGAAVYEDNNLAVAVWGDDLATDEVDGLVTAEDFTFRIWRAIEQVERTVKVTYASGDINYQDDGVSILKKLEVTSTLAGPELHIYPNPTDGTLNVSYELTRNEPVMLSIFDVYGKELLRKEVTDNGEGRHVITIDLTPFSSGLYICDFKSGSLNKAVKVRKY